MVIPILGWPPFPTPRRLTPADPALKLPSKYVRQRNRDETSMRQLLEIEAPKLRQLPEKQQQQKMQELSQRIFEVTYGKGVTPQIRENFLLQYGCTGWTPQVLTTIVTLCQTRGIVEIGAGHGQWARALSEAHDDATGESSLSSKLSPEQQPRTKTSKKRFDFVLAYDDMSNLPLNTHIYNAYTKPHHQYFGHVHKLANSADKQAIAKVVQSWQCRGRALLLVYPPPGDMALQVVQTYVNAAAENDTILFVGEGRGGANANDALFDFFETGDWILRQELDVQRPPGNKGYEKLFILERRKKC